MIVCVRCINLWNYQRHIGVHAENRRVIDNNCSALSRYWDKFSLDFSSGAEKYDVDLIKRVLDELLYRDQLIMKANRFPSGSRGRDRTQSGDGKISSLNHTQKFRANGAS